MVAQFPAAWEGELVKVVLAKIMVLLVLQGGPVQFGPLVLTQQQGQAAVQVVVVLVAQRPMVLLVH